MTITKTFKVPYNTLLDLVDALEPLRDLFRTLLSNLSFDLLYSIYTIYIL